MEENSSDTEPEQMEPGDADTGSEPDQADERLAHESDQAEEMLASGSTGSSEDEEEQQFDITLAAYHSYMGSGMTAVCGRRVLEPGWTGRVPVWAHHGVVFPGETVPVLRVEVHHAPDAQALQAIHKDKLFGLLCPDETGSVVSGYGVLCEVWEASEARRAGGDDASLTRTFKARATHRFRLVDMPDHTLPLHLYERMRFASVRVLPELAPREPLRAARLASLDARRGPAQYYTYLTLSARLVSIADNRQPLD